MGYHHARSDEYSFHLNNTDSESTYSNQESINSLSSNHKQRIDSLFRSKRRAIQKRKQEQTKLSRGLSNTTQPFNNSDHKVLIHNSVYASPKIQRHCSVPNTISSIVSIKQTPSTIINVSNSVTPPSTTISKVDSHKAVIKPQVPVTHAIQINSSTQQELERAFGGKTLRRKSFRENRNAVQAQIEKLFADASKDNNMRNRRVNPPVQPTPPAPPPPPPPSTSPPSISTYPKSAPPPPPPLKTHPAFRNSPTPRSSLPATRNTPSPLIPSGSNSNCSTVSRTSTNKSSGSSDSQNPHMVYRVDYLGSIQLPGKATSLDVLQDPLKQLYYQYKHNVTTGQRIPLSTLSITDAGLRITRNTSITEEMDFTNSFASIAVWAAIKMVIKKKINNNGQVTYTYAFLPLICDPDVQEKFNTYYPLNVTDPTIMDTVHPPMFACVMKNMKESRVLKCHGFICRSSEDAIVIAANLYQALLGTMNSESSSSQTIINDSRLSELDGVMSDSEVMPRPPPRRRRTPPTSTYGTLRRSSSEYMLRTTATTLDFASRKLRKSIRSRQSVIKEEAETHEARKPDRIPRSASLASVNASVDNENSYGIPRNKINVGNIDDILRDIINPNGMSFTEMNPHHRELLMKMALIMSKDEIYKRSKNIMRSQKQRSSGFLSGFESDSDVSTISSVLKATKKSISRLSSRASNSLRPSYLKERTPLKKINSHGHYSADYQKHIEFYKPKTIPNQNESVDKINNVIPKTPKLKNKHETNEEKHDCSIYSECDNESDCSSKCYCVLPMPDGKPNALTKNDPNISFTQIINKTDQFEKDGSSESNRRRRKQEPNNYKMYEINLDSEDETEKSATNNSLNRPKSCTKTCARSYFSDTESKTRSLQRRNLNKGTSFSMEHGVSRSPGIVFSPQPDAIRRQKSMSPVGMNSSERNTTLRSSRKRRSNTSILVRNRAMSNDPVLRHSRRYRRNSGSLGSHGSTDSSRSNHGTDSHQSDESYEGDGYNGSSSTSSDQVLRFSADAQSGRQLHRDTFQRNPKEFFNGGSSILSVKKTAEIAALFSELKLDQKNDLIKNLQDQVKKASLDSEDEHYETMQLAQRSLRFSNNIGNSLGYLP